VAVALQLLEELAAPVGGRIVDDDHFDFEVEIDSAHAAHDLR
jgi:hypothetical protein